MKKLIILLQLLTAGILQAQPDSLWSYTYGGMSRDKGYSVIQTTDGGFAVAGVYMHGSSVHTQDAYLVKTDANGEVEWEQTYDGDGEEERRENSREVIQTSDSGYLLVGKTYSNDETGPDGWAVKTDSDGEVEWSNSYGGDGYEELYGVVETLDGCYFLVGRSNSFGRGDYDIYLIKINSDGEEIWSLTYGGEELDYSKQIIATDDSCYVIVGSTWSFGHGSKDYYMIKIDEDGEVVWSNALGTELFESCYGVVQTHDGGYALTGFQEIGEDRDVFLVVTDSEGQELWTRNYADRYGVWGKDIVQTADGDYVILSESPRRDISYDFSLFRVEQDDGDIVWSTVYGTSRYEFSSALVQTTDGGYAMTGYTPYSREEGQNLDCVWLVKTGTDIIRWLSVPDTGFAQDGALIIDMDYFNDYISPSVYLDSALVFSIRDRRHLDADIENGQLIITADEGWFGSDSLRFSVYEEDDEDNEDIIYLRITVRENNDIADLPEDDVPTLFGLKEVYPNPFNSSTSIRYSLDRDGFVTLKLYDLAGREVASFANKKQSAGNYQTVWDAEGEPSGMYLLRLNVGGREKVTKLILMR